LVRRIAIAASPGKRDPFDRPTYLPFVNITLLHNGADFRVRALLDTGADGAVVPAAVIHEHLGLKYEDLDDSGHGVAGMGGYKARRLDLTIRYRGWVYDGPVMVPDPKCGLKTTLLGRGDFFSAFRVEFDWTSFPAKFHLERVHAPYVIASPAELGDVDEGNVIEVSRAAAEG